MVNAASMDMAPHNVDAIPVPPEWSHGKLWVYDLVYTPRHTAWLRAAALRGHRTIDGVSTLVLQGAEAFTLWTGMPAPVLIIESAVMEALTRGDNSHAPG